MMQMVPAEQGFLVGKLQRSNPWRPRWPGLPDSNESGVLLLLLLLLLLAAAVEYRGVLPCSAENNPTIIIELFRAFHTQKN
jgi:hypothetical protein